MAEAKKRFALLAWERYEAGGGWNDFVSGHETSGEAYRAGSKMLSQGNTHYFQVVDCETLKVVSSGKLTKEGPIVTGVGEV